MTKRKIEMVDFQPNQRMLETDQRTLEALRKDTCPDCGALGMCAGPRGGEGQNLICSRCNAGFNVALPRYIFWAQRIQFGG